MAMMEFSSDTKRRRNTKTKNKKKHKYKNPKKIIKMISFSWEEGAQIVEDLENDNIDQVGQ